MDRSYSNTIASPLYNSARFFVFVSNVRVLSHRLAATAVSKGPSVMPEAAGDRRGGSERARGSGTEERRRDYVDRRGAGTNGGDKGRYDGRDSRDSRGDRRRYDSSRDNYRGSRSDTSRGSLSHSRSSNDVGGTPGDGKNSAEKRSWNQEDTLEKQAPEKVQKTAEKADVKDSKERKDGDSSEEGGALSVSSSSGGASSDKNPAISPRIREILREKLERERKLHNELNKADYSGSPISMSRSPAIQRSASIESLCGKGGIGAKDPSPSPSSGASLKSSSSPSAPKPNGDGKMETEPEDSASPAVVHSPAVLRAGSALKEREEAKDEDAVPEEDLPEEEGGEATSGEPMPYHLPPLMGCRPVEAYRRLNAIDEGTYGMVFRGADRQTGEVVAVKKIKMDQATSGFPITSLREINILLSLQHPNIVDLKEIVVGRKLNKIYMVMEYMEHDMKMLMRSLPQPFHHAEVKCLLKQLLEGVKCMHENWILHRDLKTSNLLLNNKGVLKICDFGLARRYGSPIGQYTGLVVTLWYRAPELLFGAKTYTAAVDMWSVGCIFAEFILKEPLLPGNGEMAQVQKMFKLLGTVSSPSISPHLSSSVCIVSVRVSYPSI